MKIQLNTDRNVDGSTRLAAHVSGVVESALVHVSAHVTRVEVHLSDENSHGKDGDRDKRCVMEARLEGRQPIAVVHNAPTVDQAIDGAADKLSRLIDNTLGRARDRGNRGADPAPLDEILPDA